MDFVKFLAVVITVVAIICILLGFVKPPTSCDIEFDQTTNYLPSGSGESKDNKPNAEQAEEKTPIVSDTAATSPKTGEQ